MDKTTDLKALVEKATPGKWGVEDPLPYTLSIVANPDAPTYNWQFVGEAHLPDEEDQWLTKQMAIANAELFALAPSLATEVIRLREEIERRDDLLVRWLSTASSGKWRDGAGLSIAAHPVADDTVAALKGREE